MDNSTNDRLNAMLDRWAALRRLRPRESLAVVQELEGTLAPPDAFAGWLHFWQGLAGAIARPMQAAAAVAVASGLVEFAEGPRGHALQ